MKNKNTLTPTSKKIINAWAMYDWANSAYSLIITSAIFPAYYTAIAPPQINFFGRTFERSSLASYAISFSFLIIALLSPILSSIADYRGSKKRFMQFFCYLGAAACIGLFFITKENITLGIILSIIASVGYCGSIVFYNAYLPEIAHKDEQDAVSAKGFAYGYIGSVLLMIFCLALIILNEKLNWNFGSLPIRLSFVFVGVWWFAFAQYSFYYLPNSVAKNSNNKNILLNGFRELKLVWQELKHQPVLKRFLQSFFFYNMGVQTVMYLATYFAADELKMNSTQLIITILIIQLVAIVGATLFAKISKLTNNIFTLSIIIIIWILICFFASRIQTIMQFYIIAFSVGMVMGGIQSLSRSTYSKFLPPTKDTASYFSFFDVCDKTGTVIGTLTFGYVGEFLGGMRHSVLAIMLFFIIGLGLLLYAKWKK